MSAATWAGVSLLGGVGAAARYGAGALAARTRLGRDFPAGTLVVNLAGAFGLGVLTGLGAGGAVLLLLGGGLLGALTTFSTWMLELDGLARSGRRVAAVAYALGAGGAGLALVALGRLIGEALA